MTTIDVDDEDTAPRRLSMVWIPHRPEQRFSIVVDRFLDAALVPPFYASAQHDADEGGRTNRQRARDKERGVKPGALDWDVVQSGVWRKVELKRGKNGLSDNQKVTVRKLTDCQMPPVVAHDLREMVLKMLLQGFRFKDNLETLLQKYEAQLDALDRRAELTLKGEIAPKKARARKASPRFTANARQRKKMNANQWG